MFESIGERLNHGINFRGELMFGACENLLYDARNPKLVLCDNLEGWDGVGGGRAAQEGGDTCIPMTDSC